MKQRTRIAVSVLAGVCAMALTVWYTGQIQANAEKEQQEMLTRYGGELVEVCVATRDIEAGETVDASSLQVEEWVATLLPAEAYTSANEVEGKEATTRIPKNSVLCAAHFEANERALSVPKGKVAVSVAMDAEHAVGGVIEINEYVDVYVSKDGVADRLCGARVIDTSIEEGEGSMTWATLAVDAENVSEVLAADAKGTVSLAIPAKASEKSEEKA